MTRRTLGYLLYACGRNGLPPQVVLADNTYRLQQVLKHDFFAATALYEAVAPTPSGQTTAPKKVVLKLARKQHLFGLPLAWLGQGLCRHEVSMLQLLSGLTHVPRVLSTYGKTGFTYEYIEGSSLKEQKEIPHHFFDQLLELLRQIHLRNVVYLDMNKRGNILLGADGQPYLIDFQISLHVGDYFLLSKRLTEYLRQTLQWADIYHLFKHKRRLCPRFLWPHEKTLSHEVSPLIQIHRLVATPIRVLRRALLRFLHAKGVLAAAQHTPQPTATQSTRSPQ
ncbi:MAG: hypothetical protein ACYS76_09470 [Planctomycetota bacterium]|jgi:serine/threonine protein kinase